jgi:hypothetical protein
MFENFPDINLDPTVERKNRLLKLAIGASVLALVALSVFFISRIDVFPSAVTVVNDTGGTVLCNQRVKTNAGEHVQSSGRITAGEDARVSLPSNCAVFEAGGRYTACILLRDDNVARINATSADRSVSAEVCVYPR